MNPLALWSYLKLAAVGSMMAFLGFQAGTWVGKSQGRDEAEIDGIKNSNTVYRRVEVFVKEYQNEINRKDGPDAVARNLDRELCQQPQRMPPVSGVSDHPSQGNPDTRPDGPTAEQLSVALEIRDAYDNKAALRICERAARALNRTLDGK